VAIKLVKGDYIKVSNIHNASTSECNSKTASQVQINEIKKWISHPFEILSGARSLDQFSRDLFRRPEKTKAATESMMPDVIAPGIRNAKALSIPQIIQGAQIHALRPLDLETECEAGSQYASGDKLARLRIYLGTYVPQIISLGSLSVGVRGVIVNIWYAMHMALSQGRTKTPLKMACTYFGRSVLRAV